MKTKITLSALALLFTCLTLNAFNNSIHNNSEPITESVLDENAPATVDLNGFIFEFLGVQYNLDGTSTWTYRVTGNGARRDLSHWKLKLFNQHNVTSSSPNTWEVHVDPHFRYYGIKWDSSVRKNGGTKTFSFTLDGRYDVGDVDFGYKAGRKLFHGVIQGPTTPSENIISGTVFNDTNANGVQDGVEGFLPGVEVKLYDDANANGLVDAGEALIDSKITDGVGDYLFSGTSALNVVVKAMLPANTTDFSYQATTSLTSALLLSANDITDVDFGIKRTQVVFYDISGVVYDDDNQNMINDNEAGLVGVEVKMYHDANANAILDAGESLLATTTTDANGAYIFTQVNVTHVIIEVVKPQNTTTFEYVATTDTQEAITMVNQNIIDVNFGIDQIQIVNYNISGTVFDDNNANGTLDFGENVLANVTLTLYADNDNNGRVGAGDTAIGTTTTDRDGIYGFSAVTVKNTLVAVTVPTNTGTYTYVLTTSAEVVTSSLLTDVTGVNFGINQEEVINYNISGTVYDDDSENGMLDAGEGALENITLTLYADNDNNGRIGAGDTIITTTTSAADGTFNFANVTTRNTIVAVTVPANGGGFMYTLTTTDSRVTGSTTIDIVNVNFGINKESDSYTISGNVFNDVNSDGDNTGDSGLSGVEVRLYADTNQNGRVDRGEPLIMTTNSDRNGNYQFIGLTDIFVIVQVVVPANTTQFQYMATTQVNVALNSGLSANNVNFGINRTVVILYNISGVVWDDANSDQIKDANELRLGGIAVTLYNDANASGTIDVGDAAISTITTSDTGAYVFTGVNLPNVIVAPTVPSNGTLTTSGLRAISSINTNVVNADFGINIEDSLYQVTGVV
ncbi:SdrD B-like domain-containing protein, partial [Kordia zhangzhouensis]|uniref:SdrD B-like domain-containing protein n=1 Tax=Kordia zhangzhouensis TaxID=1620405 RepID=UPI0006292ECC